MRKIRLKTKENIFLENFFKNQQHADKYPYFANLKDETKKSVTFISQ